MCSITSWLQNTKSSARRCSRFSSEPDSRLSTQMTRSPLPSRYSQRWEPRNPAPPVTTAVGIREMLSGGFGRSWMPYELLTEGLFIRLDRGIEHVIPGAERGDTGRERAPQDHRALILESSARHHAQND